MRLLVLSVSILLGISSALAVPAKPTPVKYTQPDGSVVTVQLRGDERHHWYQTIDGYLLVNNNNTLYYGEVMPNGSIAATKYAATEIAKRSDAVKSFLKQTDMTLTIEALNKQRMQSPRIKSEQAIAKSRVSSTTTIQKASSIENIYGKGLFSDDHFPVFGEQKGLVILVEYSDVKFTNPEVNYEGNVQAYYKEMLNGDNFTKHNATGSARQWFIDNSNGQFIPEFDVYGPVELPHKMSYYGANDYLTGDDLHPELMAVEACQMLDDIVDFSQYDRDGDGYIDNAYIIYAGKGEASGGSADTVWPHSWNVSSAGSGTYSFDGVTLDRYACSNEWEGEAPDGIGTFVHEFSHVLGLPDIYPTSYTEAFTPGDYCVMDYGNYNNDGRTPPNYGIFERNALGWMHPTELSGKTVADYILNPIDDNDGYAILTNRTDEFFLIENRQQTGWDKYIPGHGMLVWHIDYNQSVWINNTVNNDKNHQYVDIVEADDIRSKESRAGDTFPGTRNVTNFTHRTVPAMKTWAGVELKVPLRDITEEDGIIKFSGGYIPVPAPGAVTAFDVAPTDITTTSFTAKWSADANSTYYLLNVYNKDNLIIWNRKNVGNSDQAIVTGLKPDNLYYFTITPCNEDADGEPSNMVAVRTLPPTLDFLKTTALDATDVGSTYFTANWETIDIANSYIINVFKQEATPLNNLSVDFSGDGNAIPEGWKTNAEGITNNVNLCGESAPALYFTKKGYLLTSSFEESIKRISFHLVIDAPQSGAALKVMGMTPNSYAWKEIEIIDLEKFTGGIVTCNDLPEDINSIYLEYIAAGDCKIALDDISITYGGTVIESSAHEIYTDFATSEPSSLKLEGMEPDTQYEYTVQAINDTHHARVSNTIIVRTAQSSGIENAEIDNNDIEPIYYNLQGIHIYDLHKGELYIECRGQSRQKIIFK